MRQRCLPISARLVILHSQKEQWSLVTWFYLLILWTKCHGVTIQTKPFWQHFHVVLFVSHYFKKWDWEIWRKFCLKPLVGRKGFLYLLANLMKVITYLDSSSWCDLDATTLLSDATSLRISSRIIRFPSGVFSSSLLLFTWVWLVTLKVDSAVEAMYEDSLDESVFSNFKRKNNVY